jgi:hypothetical protein
VKWFAMSTAILKDPKVVELGERHGPVGPLWWTALLCEAGAQDRAGVVDLAIRNFAFSIFSDARTVNEVLDSALDVGLCHAESRDVRSFKVTIPNWEKHQAKRRQAEARARKKEQRELQEAESHAESRDVTRERDREIEREKDARDVSPYDRKTIEVQV